MTAKMELLQIRNNRILNFVRKHDTNELFLRIKNVCNTSKKDSAGSRIKKFEFINTVLKERVLNDEITYDFYRMKIDNLRMKF